MRLPYASGKVTLTSRFGWRTLNGMRDYHKGVDLCGTDKTLVAPCDGVIGTSAMLDKATDKTLTWQWGNFVRIDTPDGLQIFMCHMSQRKVKQGDRVKAGDIIGVEGNTGYSFGSHCHFEIRKNGKSIDPTPYLGIPNAWGIHDAVNTPVAFPDEYTHDGLTFVRAKNFKIVYFDGKKKTYTRSRRYINAGFFANYEEGGVRYTLPVANVKCDIVTPLSAFAQKYIGKFTSGGKLTYNCRNNQSKDFRALAPATLVVPLSGKPYVTDTANIPPNTKYALSGVPTVRNGDDVDYYNYVKPQGWKEGVMYGTDRNWIGVRNGEIWIITGKTKAPNYIYGMEFWKKVKSEGFDDIIALDGGGSYFYRNGGATKTTFENRRINTVIEF